MSEKKDDGHGGGDKKKGPNAGTLIAMAVGITVALFLVAVGLSQFGEIVWGSHTAIEGAFRTIVNVMMMFVPPILILLLVVAILKAINKKKDEGGAHHS